MQVQDEEIYLSDSDGNNDVRDYPVQVRCVKDIYNDEWTLEELSGKGGAWQAAVVAKCVLQPASEDGSTEEKAIYMTLHTERGGELLVFGLTNGLYYSA